MIDLRRQLLGLGERIRINLCPYPHMNPRILTVALIARLENLHTKFYGDSSITSRVLLGLTFGEGQGNGLSESAPVLITFCGTLAPAYAVWIVGTSTVSREGPLSQVTRSSFRCWSALEASQWTSSVVCFSSDTPKDSPSRFEAEKTTKIWCLATLHWLIRYK